MANPVASVVSFVAPRGNLAGQIVLDLTWTAYAQNADVLDISNIAGRFPGFEVEDVKAFYGVVPTTGHVITFVPAASPALNNLGVLRAWAGVTQVTAGAFANVARCVLTVAKRQLV